MRLRTIPTPVLRQLHKEIPTQQQHRQQHHPTQSDPVRTRQKRHNNRNQQRHNRRPRPILSQRQRSQPQYSRNQSPNTQQRHSDSHPSRQTRTTLETHEHRHPMPHHREHCGKRQNIIRATQHHPDQNRNHSLHDIQRKYHRAMHPPHLPKNIRSTRISRPHLENINPRAPSDPNRKRQRTKQIRDHSSRDHSNNFVTYHFASDPPIASANRANATSTYSCDISYPTNDRPNSTAAMAVAPLPINGSSTTSSEYV